MSGMDGFDRMREDWAPRKEVSLELPESLRNSLRQKQEKDRVEEEERREEERAPEHVPQEQPDGTERDLERAGGSEGSAQQAAVDVGDAGQPSPQQNDPDDGEHRASEHEEPAEEPEEATEEESPSEPVPAPTLAAQEPAAEAPREPEPSGSETVAALKRSNRKPPSGTEYVYDSSGRSRGGLAYDDEDSSEAWTQIRRVPALMIKVLRESLATWTGVDFAEKCSAGTLLTAFVLSRYALDLPGLDANTAMAAQAYREMEPELTLLEDRLERLLEGVEQMGKQVDSNTKATRKASAHVEALELGQAYSIADRVELIGQHDRQVASADFSHPKALEVRNRLRSLSKAQQQIDGRSEGRPMR